MKALVVLPLEQRHKDLFCSSCPKVDFIFSNGKEINTDDLKNAEVIIGNINIKYLKDASKLEWLQLNSAGSDAYIKAGVLPKNVILTNSTGAYGLAISEHMLALTLSLIKKLNMYQDNQRKCLWNDEGNVTSIYSSRTLVVGLGDIGGEYARKMKALGSYVVGIKKHIDNKPEYVDELYTMDRLDEELQKADFVALTLPGNSETKGLININKMKLMKKSSVLINVGRGNAIVTDDLVYALNNKIIFGAGLDVTDPEPLPKEHPLWKANNIIITPHISGVFHLPETFERIVKIAIKNLTLFCAGEKLNNIVDFETGYKKHD